MLAAPRPLLSFCLLLAALSHCGPAARPSHVERIELPRYTPAQAVLFDDQFHEAVFRQVYWTPDHKLGDRVRLADAVVVARITTASEIPSSEGGPDIVVELRPWGTPLAGAAPEGPVLLTLSPDSPSHRLFRWQKPRLLGRDVVLLIRRYEQNGEVRVHFRAEPNLQDVHLAIRQAIQQAAYTSSSTQQGPSSDAFSR